MKFIKNINEYALEKGVCRQKASRMIKENKNIISLPKGVKFIEIQENQQKDEKS